MKIISFQNIYFLFLFFLSIFLINNQIISHIIWKFPEPFVDYLHQVTWLRCNFEGYNLFSDNSLNCNGLTRFNYGKIFLVLPYNYNLDFFYTQILPFILIFLFIYSVKKIIDPKDFLTYSLFSISILNPSTFLLLERANMDLIIFIILVFIVFNRIYFINWILLFFFSLVKFYPSILFINIFLENFDRKIKSYIYIIITISIFTFVYLFFNSNEYTYSIQNLSSAKAGYHYLYSLNSLPKILKYLTNFNYGIMILVLYSFFIFLSIKFNKKFDNNIIVNLKSEDTKLFVLSGCLLFVCFFFFSNWFYREVFLIATYPFIINHYLNHKDKFSKNLIKLIFARYFFLYLYSYINIYDGISHVDGIRIFSSIFISTISIKAFIDLILMFFLGIILMTLIKKILKDLRNKTLSKL